MFGLFATDRVMGRSFVKLGVTFFTNFLLSVFVSIIQVGGLLGLYVFNVLHLGLDHMDDLLLFGATSVQVLQDSGSTTSGRRGGGPYRGSYETYSFVFF